MSNSNTIAPPIEGLHRGDLIAQVRGVAGDASAWFTTHWLAIAVAIAIGVGIFGLLLLLRGWAIRLCKRGEGVATWYSIIGRALAKTGTFFMIMTSARLVIGYADAPPLIHATIVFLFTIAAVFQAAIWAREIIFGAIEHRTQADPGHDHGLASALGIIRLLVTIVLFAISVVLVLSNLGVNVTGLVAGLGVGGIAIGLAAQGVFADLFAALAIIFDRPFRLGDSISYDKGSGAGTVEAIGLKSTRVRGGNGEERIIANRKLLDFEILNTTRRARNRFKFDFHLGYGIDPDLVRSLPGLLKEAVESEGYVLVHGGLNGFSDAGLSYDLEFESVEIDFPAEARDRVAAAVLERFHANHIDFAYPTSVNLIAGDVEKIPTGTAKAD
ncbi:mechanosensitive ion channel [Sphingomonas sp. JC676]|uniref:mechanosensitive ion channel family protein n=1 Tax=Sphingomonas sp. JC676 TaxID=2768065 RepID=UPI0016578E47|nr:mechanosensitive ion channel domain-containing protein [Sphingomonas sp. JC676]MBC9033839.1 mechanosensitive ion channel [Sphingomonas sp. JC676]